MSSNSSEQSIKIQAQKVGLILIGDELLSGVRQDKHMESVRNSKYRWLCARRPAGYR